MAEKSLRLSQNSPGRFYVDSTCIDCDLCRETAPDFFRRNDELGVSVVIRQPETPFEVARAKAALEDCPSESIGDDGLPKQRPTSLAALQHDGATEHFRIAAPFKHA
jgi:ferredoxin